jgi:two-component system sensor histidine kinase KdpD
MAGIIAVGISSSSNAQRLMRWAKRTSESLGTGWCVIHVDDGSLPGSADKESLEANLSTAASMGAEIVTAVGPDVAASLIAAAREKKAIMLVIGRSGLSASGFFPRRATISDKILRSARDLDVVVVSDESAPAVSSAIPSLLHLFSAPWTQYALLCGVFALVTGLCLLLQPVLDRRNMALLYLAAVLLLSLVAGPAPVVLLAIVSSLAYNFFFIPPKFTLTISSPEDILLFIIYFLVAAVTGFLSAGLRSRERMLLRRDRAASFLLAATDRLSGLTSIEEAAVASSEIVDSNFGTTSAVCVAPWEDAPELIVGSAASSLSEGDRARAKSCIEHGAVTGFPSGKRRAEEGYRFVPASAGGPPVAAIGYRVPVEKGRTEEIDHLLLAFGRSLALFIERARSDELSKRVALELESERLAKVLFDSVSHELKTPLTSITGSLSALRDQDLFSQTAIRTELVDGALQSAERLTRVVDDLLSIGRIETGTLKLKREPVEASELARAALEAVSDHLSGRKLTLRLPEETGVYVVDAVLVNRLAVNLLENACKYSRPGASVELAFADKNDGLSLTVRDSGPGFSPERMLHPFAKFTRRTGDKQGGLGLGLAICKGIAEAHGGSIEAHKTEKGFEIEAFLPKCKEGDADARAGD